jgi:hypothetical protein
MEFEDNRIIERKGHKAVGISKTLEPRKATNTVSIILVWKNLVKCKKYSLEKKVKEKIVVYIN